MRDSFEGFVFAVGIVLFLTATWGPFAYLIERIT